MSDFVICINNDSNAADQIRSIDKQRLVRRLGTLKTETMDRVDRASKISMGLIKI
jgi:mRNA interferase MazF